MKARVLLVLILTRFGANADNEGPSDVLKSTWSKTYLFNSQHISPRCVRSCDQGAVDVYWNRTLGNAAQLLSKSRFIEILTEAYTRNREMFINNIRGNITLGVRSLDADNNGFISAEEYYTEFLCLGFGLENIKKGFDVHHSADKGIPVSDYIAGLVKYYTEPDEDSDLQHLFDDFESE